MSRYTYASDEVKYRISEAMRRMGLAPPDFDDGRQGDRYASQARDDRLFLSAAEIATRLGLSAEAASQRLRRARNENNQGTFWEEVADPKPRQAHYLYRLGAARQLFRRVKRVSGQKISSRKNP